MRNVKARADVFFNQAFFYVVTQSMGTFAYPEPEATPHFLPPDTDDASLGKTLRVALRASKTVSAEEFQRIWNSGQVNDIEKAHDTLAMENYGFKTRRAMYKNMDSCSVCIVDGTIEIQPLRHTSIDGYTADKVQGPFRFAVSEDVSDAELGAALRKGFSLCS